MNYNETVSTVREIARDGLRLQAVNRFRADLLEVEISKGMVADSRKEIEKDTARAEYNLSKVDSANPDFENITKSLQEDLKYLNEQLESNGKTSENLDKKAEEINKKIDAVQSGETKISKDSLNDETARLLQLMNTQRAQNLASNVSVPENAS